MRRRPPSTVPPMNRRTFPLAQVPNTLPDSSSDVRLTATDWALGLGPPGARSADGSPGPGAWRNSNTTSTIPFQLTANESTRAFPRNLRRCGMQICNLDSAADLRFSFGNDLGAYGLLGVPRGTVLYDFTCPPDELYLYSTANIFVVVMEIIRLDRAG